MDIVQCAADAHPADLWREIYQLRTAVKGPDGFATWQDLAVKLRYELKQMQLAAAEQRCGHKSADDILAATAHLYEEQAAQTCKSINPPKFPSIPEICNGMEPQQVWEYACLTGWRCAEVATEDQASAQEPVAWLHDDPTRIDVCHNMAKEVWLQVKPKHVEHYTIPLFTHPSQDAVDAVRYRYACEHGVIMLNKFGLTTTTKEETDRKLDAARAQQPEAVPVVPEGWKLVPEDPVEAQWDGLSRAIIMGWELGCNTPRKLFEHLKRSGNAAPQWLTDEPEMQALDHVPSKGTRAVIIYRAMLAAAPPAPTQSGGKGS